jgi:hypothetical protein
MASLVDESPPLSYVATLHCNRCNQVETACDRREAIAQEVQEKTLKELRDVKKDLQDTRREAVLANASVKRLQTSVFRTRLVLCIAFFVIVALFSGFVAYVHVDELPASKTTVVSSVAYIVLIGCALAAILMLDRDWLQAQWFALWARLAAAAAMAAAAAAIAAAIISAVVAKVVVSARQVAARFRPARPMHGNAIDVHIAHGAAPVG